MSESHRALRSLRRWVAPLANDARESSDDPFGFIAAEQDIKTIQSQPPMDEHGDGDHCPCYVRGFRHGTEERGT